jgi:hypothetical protein
MPDLLVEKALTSRIQFILFQAFYSIEGVEDLKEIRAVKLHVISLFCTEGNAGLA